MNWFVRICILCYLMENTVSILQQLPTDLDVGSVTETAMSILQPLSTDLDVGSVTETAENDPFGITFDFFPGSAAEREYEEPETSAFSNFDNFLTQYNKNNMKSQIIGRKLKFSVAKSSIENSEDVGIEDTDETKAASVHCMHGNTLIAMIDASALNATTLSNYIESKYEVITDDIGGVAATIKKLDDIISGIKKQVEIKKQLKENVDSAISTFDSVFSFLNFGSIEDAKVIFKHMFDLQEVTFEQKLRFACFPAHGFHQHTSSTVVSSRPPQHYGPYCDFNQYYSLDDKKCKQCATGLAPDWMSILEIAKHDHVQYFDPDLCENVDQTQIQDLLSTIVVDASTIPYSRGTFSCRLLAERLGFVKLLGGDGTKTAIDSKILTCIHYQCATSVDKEYSKVLTTTWNVANLHMGQYHPYSPIRCKKDIDFEVQRGDCGECSYLSDICIPKSFINKQCQRTLPQSTPFGLDQINKVDYTYKIPSHDTSTQQLVILPDNIYFEGPDEDLTLSKYCFKMKHDLSCDDSSKEFSPVSVDEKYIYVSEGTDTYLFYNTKECNSNPWEPFHKNMYSVEPNTKYIIKRCNDATTSPFHIRKMGVQRMYNGLTGDTELEQMTGGHSRIYEWSCRATSIHECLHNHTGYFIVVDPSIGSTYTVQNHENNLLNMDKTCQMVETASSTNTMVTEASDINNVYSNEADNSVGTNMEDQGTYRRRLMTYNNPVFEDCVSVYDKTEWRQGTVNGEQLFINYFDDPGSCFKSIQNHDRYQEATGVSFCIKTKRCYMQFGFGVQEHPMFVTKDITPKTQSTVAKVYDSKYIFPKATLIPDATENDAIYIVYDDPGVSFEVRYDKASDDGSNIEYKFETAAELGTIIDAHAAYEYLDSDDALVEYNVQSKRNILALGVNYIVPNTETKWASIHVVELSDKGDKSICLVGFFNKPIKEIHGIAVVPFSLDDSVKIPQATDDIPGFYTDPKTEKDDIGLILVSLTDNDDDIRMWMSSYEGIPMDATDTSPGSYYQPFNKKWSKYALHRPSQNDNYLLMAVIADDNTVFVFDGIIDQTESFFVSDGQLMSTSNGQLDSPKAPNSVKQPIRDIEWTSDKKLIVLTETGVYLYTRIRSNAPLVPCVLKDRKFQLTQKVPSGKYYTFNDKECDLAIHNCPPGKYQDLRGQSECKDCDQGKYQPSEAQPKCEDCFPGQFQYLIGMLECDDCLPGFFAGQYGTIGLGVGEHNSIMLDYTCDQCPTGYFSMEKTAIECKRCINPDLCDIEAQIIPHAICSDNSNKWLDETDHIHQLCCSDDEYEDTFYTSSMRILDWRQNSKLYCVNRQKIKPKPVLEDCNPGEILENAGNPSEVNDLNDALSKYSRGEISLEEILEKIDVLETLLNNDDAYFEKTFINDTRDRIMVASDNISACISRNIDLTRASNTTVATPTNTSITDQSIVPANYEIVPDSYECFVTDVPQTIEDEFKACCPNYASSPLSSNVLNNGNMNINPGDDIVCMKYYLDNSLDTSQYSYNDMTSSEAIAQAQMGCYMDKNIEQKHFHPKMQEIIDCCPSAKEEIESLDVSFWEFSNSNHSIDCLKNKDGSCSIRYAFLNKNATQTTIDNSHTISNLNGERCDDFGFFYEPKLMEVTALEPCEDGWTFVNFINKEYRFNTVVIDKVQRVDSYTFDNNLKCQTTNISDTTSELIINLDKYNDGAYCYNRTGDDTDKITFKCPAGFSSNTGLSSNTGHKEYMVITNGSFCNDYDDYEDMPFSDCYTGPEIWKRFFAEDHYNEVVWDTSAKQQYIPKVCTVTFYAPERIGDLVLQTPLSSNKMKEQFKNQTCTTEFPCICQKTSSCVQIKDPEVCSEKHPCKCQANTTECNEPFSFYFMEDTCKCSSNEQKIEPRIAFKEVGGTDTTDSTVKKTWKHDSFAYNLGSKLIDGVKYQVVASQMWKNANQSLPSKVATDADEWYGVVAGDYIVDVEVYDTEELLIDMKGGIDYESTRGTDEFRYCRKEWQTYINGIEETKSVYCSSFFPIATKLDNGDWTCSSVQKCPYWQHWPPAIDEESGFVETDPCICNDRSEYNGYCIPDAEVLVPKKGNIGKVLEDVLYGQTMDNDIVFVENEVNVSATTIAISATGVMYNYENLQLNVSGIEIDKGLTLSSQGSRVLPSYAGDVVAVSLQHSIKVYAVVHGEWVERNGLSSGYTPQKFAIDKTGAHVAFLTPDSIRIFKWDVSGQKYNEKSNGLVSNTYDEIELSDDGNVISVSSGNVVHVYRWRDNAWKQQGENIVMTSDIKSLSISADNNNLMVCESNLVTFYEWRRGTWDVDVAHPESDILACSWSSDKSVVALRKTNNVIETIATGLEDDTYEKTEFWVKDVDEIFTNVSHHKYHRACNVGSIKKASVETDWTDISWWQDAYDRACRCENELCSGYVAHDVYIGFNETINSKELLTMTCANDGCVYDKIDKNMFQDSKIIHENCEGARDEICGVYSFGKYHSEMSYKILRGVYDEDGLITRGIFNCPSTDGSIRNNFYSHIETEVTTMYTHDGDFHVMPNNMPKECACASTICLYDEYCKIVEDDGLSVGICAGSKLELKDKMMENQRLDECAKPLPDVISGVDLSFYKIHETCKCNGHYCEDGYCSKDGCVTCPCGPHEYEHQTFVERTMSTISTCKPITQCKAGQEIEQYETATSDRVCRDCPEGSYATLPNTDKCKACTPCDLPHRPISECNSTHDVECIECRDNEEAFKGRCVPICRYGEHRMQDGRCLLCDYGQYFANDTCVSCPENHFTYTKTSADISSCLPHLQCNTTTHFWRQEPNASFAGICQQRYYGICHQRIPGSATSDDSCINLRSISDTTVATGLAQTLNKSVNAFFEHENAGIIEAIKYALFTGEYNQEPSDILSESISRIFNNILWPSERVPYVTINVEDVTINVQEYPTLHIYTLLNRASLQYWNLSTTNLFNMSLIDQSVSLVHFTKDKEVVIEEGPWRCSNRSETWFRCNL